MHLFCNNCNQPCAYSSSRPKAVDAPPLSISRWHCVLHSHSAPFSFLAVCPYAYIASRKVAKLSADTGLKVQYKPVLLGGLYKATAAPQGKDGSATDVMAPPKRALAAMDLTRYEHCCVDSVGYVPSAGSFQTSHSMYEKPYTFVHVNCSCLFEPLLLAIRASWAPLLSITSVLNERLAACINLQIFVTFFLRCACADYRSSFRSSRSPQFRIILCICAQV